MWFRIEKKYDIVNVGIGGNKYKVKNVGIYFQKLFLWSWISPITDTEWMSFLVV